MDELPLVREIRAARQRLAQVAGAGDLLRRLEGDRMALGILERQYGKTPEVVASSLPGADTMSDVGERFTALEDLTVPTRATPDRAMSERRRVLDELATSLGALAREERDASSTLHELRHDQHHQLKDPRYADAMATLTGIVAERDEVQNELNPRRARSAAVGPSQHLMSHLRTELAWVNEPITDNIAVTAYRALAIASGLLDVLRQCLADTGFDLPVPESPAVPDGPDADAAPEQIEWVRTQLRQVAELESALSGQRSALEAEIAGLEDTLRHHNQRIEEMLG